MMRRESEDQSGFTLIEVSLAIFITALLLTGVVLPLRTQLEVRMLDETNRLIEQAKEALLGYVAMYGHFPCPASATSNGWEAAPKHEAEFEVTGDRTCPSYVGFLPAAELGITTVDAQGYAIDGWGRPENRLRYAVSDATVPAVGGVVDSMTVEAGIQSAGIDGLLATDLLHVCASAAGVTPGIGCGSAANTLTSKAAVVIWSLGPNAASGGTSADERENPNPNGLPPDRVFVSRPRSLGTATEFDDIVAWLPLPLIINRLVAAGHLP